MAKQNKPAIRFKGFTDAWEQRKLGEVSESYSGGTPSVGVKEYYGGQIPFIRSAEINSEITELFLTEEGLKKSSARLVAMGDILYALYGATSGEVGRARLRGAINQAILAINPHTGYDSEYLAQWLRKSKHSIIETYLQGGQGNLSGTIVKELLVDFPSLKEQRAIGDFFSQLDHLITLHQRKYDKLQILKKAMLEKMFPKNGSSVPEIRFKGFTDAWEQRKLGEIVEIKDSARIPNNEWSDIGVPYIRASDISSENLKGTLFISSERYEFYKNKTGAPMRGDVLFNGGGEIGKSIICNDSKPIYVQGGAVLYARTSASNELEASYLKTYYETSHSRKYIDAASAGGTMKHFTLKPAQEMPVYLPEAEEQKQIGDFYICIDHLITLHQRELEKLQNIKKSMLEKMFV